MDVNFLFIHSIRIVAMNWIVIKTLGYTTGALIGIPVLIVCQKLLALTIRYQIQKRKVDVCLLLARATIENGRGGINAVSYDLVVPNGEIEDSDLVLEKQLGDGIQGIIWLAKYKGMTVIG